MRLVRWRGVAGDRSTCACPARELTRVATVDTEAAWLTAAAKHTVREIEEMVTGRRRGDSPDDPPDPAARLHELRLLLPAAVLGKFTAARRALGLPLDAKIALYVGNLKAVSYTHLTLPTNREV